MKKRMRGIAAIAFAAVTIISLAGNPIPAQASAKAPKKLAVKAVTKTVDIKGKTALDVTVKPKNASAAVTYKSSNRKVAAVSKKGVVTGKKKGKATITVTSKKNRKLKKKIRITVKQLKPKSVALNRTALSLKAGESAALSAAVKPAGVYAPLSWSSGNAAVAFVDAEGKVTARSTGTAVITAVAKENRAVAAACTVTVTERSASAPAPVKADKTRLGNLISELRGLHQADYSPESWKEMQEMLREAVAVYEDEKAEQSRIDEAAALLERAIDEVLVDIRPVIDDVQLSRDSVPPEGGEVDVTVKGRNLENGIWWYSCYYIGYCEQIRHEETEDPTQITFTVKMGPGRFLDASYRQIIILTKEPEPGDAVEWSWGEWYDEHEAVMVKVSQKPQSNDEGRLTGVTVTPDSITLAGSGDKFLNATVEGRLRKTFYWQIYQVYDDGRQRPVYPPDTGLSVEHIADDSDGNTVTLPIRIPMENVDPSGGKTLRLRVGITPGDVHANERCVTADIAIR